MHIEKQQVNGVFIEHATPDGDAPGPPVVFVHGGSHGSWLWEGWLGYFAAAGRHCYAFSWFNHTGSADLPVGRFLERGILDVTEELDIVVSHIGQTPVMVAHSMGAAVVQKYAETHPVAAQVLLAPIPCKETGGEALAMDIDFTRPWPKMPYELMYEWFLEGCAEADARRYYDLMPDESPTAVWEAGQRGAAITLDRSRIGGPQLMIAGGRDIVSPADAVRNHAAHFGADYLHLPDRGHSMILEPRWRETADRVRSWLEQASW